MCVCVCVCVCVRYTGSQREECTLNVMDIFLAIVIDDSSLTSACISNNANVLEKSKNSFFTPHSNETNSKAD